MMPDKCVTDPNQECFGGKTAKEIEGRVETLDHRLTTFQQNVSDTNSRFGARIGKLEAREEVREEQYKNIKEKIDTMTKDIVNFQREQKDSISELRREHKESMAELKRGNQDILDIVAPIRQKMDNVEKLEEDVEKLKNKPAETWETIKKQSLGWFVAIILALIAAALGISQYT